MLAGRKQMKKADIIEFKRNGFVSKVLGNLLGLFERDWDKFGWHVGFAWEKVTGGWYILEATSSGVSANYYHNGYLKKNVRYWEWFIDYPEQEVMGKFAHETVGKKYDVAIYFWTAVAIIARHYFNRPIPKLLDKRFSCWELVAEGCDDFDQPIVSKYDVIILTDLIKAFKKAGLSPKVLGD